MSEPQVDFMKKFANDEKCISTYFKSMLEIRPCIITSMQSHVAEVTNHLYSNSLVSSLKTRSLISTHGVNIDLLPPVGFHSGLNIGKLVKREGSVHQDAFTNLSKSMMSSLPALKPHTNLGDTMCFGGKHVTDRMSSPDPKKQQHFIAADNYWKQRGRVHNLK